MKYQKWHIGTASEQDTALLMEAGYPSLLATVLVARGSTTAEAAAEALERETSLTISPMLMRDMDKAVARIQKALANDEPIADYGDYDVDGISSTVLLLDYLKNFRFTGDIWAVPEGTPVFPREPLITVRAPAIQAQLVETYLLLQINHQSLIATKASRICRAAPGRTVLEFGSRRAQGYDGAILGARAAYIGGCAGTACPL